MSKRTTASWRDDAELFKLARRELFTAVVGDIMDQMGYLHQFLPPQIRPLNESMTLIGRAMTVLGADVLQRRGKRTKRKMKPFGRMLDALDDLQPNEVYICTGATPNYALWGELMSTRAMKLGAAGVVLNGYTRDARGISAMNFPTFCWGTYAQDQGPRGQVLDFRVPLKMGSVAVHPGDILFGDLDGVCVVPKSIEREVFGRALDKARGEKLVRKAILAGMSANEAFKTFGIL